MTVLQVSDVRFGFAGGTLFSGVTCTLAMGERAALVAPNGAGKSTLLRIMAKEVEPEQGMVTIRRDASLGYYRQSHELKPEGDVLSAFLLTFGEITELRRELSAAQHAAASGEQLALDHLARVTDRHQLARGDELEHKVAAIASRLGFAEADLSRPVRSLSGGERGRLQLGVILAKTPDLLLLDEPTNHLDLDTIAWLESYLVGYRGAVLVVSHDRAFLDNVTSQTLELGTRGLRSYPAKYSDYVVLRAEELARERGLVERQQALIDKTEDFIRKNIAGQKTKQAQSRRKMLDKMDRIVRPEDVWQVAERIAFRFAPAARSGDIVLDAKNLGAERGGRVLFENLQLLLRRGERIGVVGPNGAGKTTLLKLLSGRGDPADAGTVRRGTNLQEGYFDQHLGDVDPSLTAVEEVRRVRGDFTVEAARQYLARFRFWGDDPLRVVSGFSGGERSRLALAKLLLEPRNLLFLDEPTNHLDIPAAEILEEALVSFEGTVVFVSHDRRFLENVATRIVNVKAGRAEVFSGGFRDFASATDGLKRGPKAHQQTQKPTRPNVSERSQENSRNLLAAASAPKEKQGSRDRERTKKRSHELEQLIRSGEAQIKELKEKLREDPSAAGHDWQKLARMAREEQALSQRVAAMMEEWARLTAS